MSTITCSSSGRLPRTVAIFAACAASSSRIAFDPEFVSTYSHSSGEFVW